MVTTLRNSNIKPLIFVVNFMNTDTCNSGSKETSLWWNIKAAAVELLASVSKERVQSM